MNLDLMAFGKQAPIEGSEEEKSMIDLIPLCCHVEWVVLTGP
jgi:hypothetical protein